MKIQVHGKQLDVGDALRSHVSERINEVVAKYSTRPTEAVVTFSRDRYTFICDATVHLSTGLTTQAKANANDVYESFDNTLDRMETQLRRYKRRLKNHHGARQSPFQSSPAAAYVISAGQGDGQDEPESLQPIIIAEMATRVPSISVGEAVMQMELSHSDVLVFRNEAHGGVNVVHRRQDGNIGWIDPEQMK